MNKTMNTAMRDRVALALIMAALMALPDVAFAQSTGSSGSSTTTLGFMTYFFASEELTYIPNLIAAVCYIVGIGMMVGGVMKLKDHAENPGQNKMAPGVARMFAGSALVTLPTFMGWVQNTMMIVGSTVPFTSFQSGMKL